MDYRFSVLISVYIKEKAEYFQECMDSVLEQTLIPDEIVIVEDGPVTSELQDMIDDYIERFPNQIKKVPLKKNVGLGLALAEGIKACKYNLIARMDADDICVPERFEKEVDAFKRNPKLDIVGCHIKEFEQSISNVISTRRVPLTNREIRKYQRKRSAFNHVTVLYKKEKVLKSGNYKNAPLMEDDLLWCEMLKNGCYGENLDDYLVYVRAGTDMLERRGGWPYFKKYREGRKRILRTGFISLWDYFITCAVQLVVSMAPLRIRRIIFKRVLRGD